MDEKTAEAISALQNGDLVIMPTETVYGIFADALNQKAVEKLYAAKGRPTEKALNLNVHDYESILRFSKNQPDYLEKLVRIFLPGPLTIILEASSEVPEWIHIGKTTVGFRMPSIPKTQKVIKEIGVLVGPSANLTGAASPVFFDDLTDVIKEKAALALQDDSIQGLDTTIIDLTEKSAKILRQGAVTRKEILAKVPEIKGLD